MDTQDTEDTRVRPPTTAIASGVVSAQEPSSEDQTHPIFGVIGFLGLVALAVGVYKITNAVDPGHIKPGQHPGVFELIFADRTTLTLVRLGVIAFVIYLGWSVFMLVKAGRPITSVAGITVEEAAERATSAGEAAVDKVRALEEQLSAAIADNEFLMELVQRLQDAAEGEDDAADDREEPDDRAAVG